MSRDELPIELECRYQDAAVLFIDGEPPIPGEAQVVHGRKKYKRVLLK